MMALATRKPTMNTDAHLYTHLYSDRNLMEVLIDAVNAQNEPGRRAMIAALRERDPNRRWLTNAGGYLMRE